MKYYEVFVNPDYVPPRPLGWFGVIDRRTLEIRKSYELPKHILLTVEEHMQTVFTDIVTFPCFMVSRKVRDVIKLYNPHIVYVRVVFLDKTKKRSMEYYIPYFTQAPDAMEKREPVLKIKKCDKETTVMRMDLMESILRRGAVGIGLKEIKKERE